MNNVSGYSPCSLLCAPAEVGNEEDGIFYAYKSMPCTHIHTGVYIVCPASWYSGDPQVSDTCQCVM